MGCGCCKSKSSKSGKPKDPNQRYLDAKWENVEDFKNGPMDDSKRKCTDCCCCIFFIIFLLACGFVGYLGFSGGNPKVILYPYDDDGNQCGQDKLKDYKYLYFYDAKGDLLNFLDEQSVSVVCVKECPKEEKPTEDYVLDCYKTSANPNCIVSKDNYYEGVECKFRKIFNI